jgi:leucyl/phenylalanyl-tRNA--protein transferase
MGRRHVRTTCKPHASPHHPHSHPVRKLPPLRPRLEADEPFPSVETAWAEGDPAPGLLAAGRRLDVPTLLQAYGLGIFPWFGEGQPILWWSPNPRMVLRPQAFRLHRSLRKSLLHFVNTPGHEIRFDTAFMEVIQACASAPRDGQPGTWIVPDMIRAYVALHRAGSAHSVETWIDGKLVGGLYCVNLGAMVFGESMFAHQTDASKIALAALVAFCRVKGVAMIDCQQNTQHLASLGAAEIPRAEFVAHVSETATAPSPHWQFERLYWNLFLKDTMQNHLTT